MYVLWYFVFACLFIIAISYAIEFIIAYYKAKKEQEEDYNRMVEYYKDKDRTFFRSPEPFKKLLKRYIRYSFEHNSIIVAIGGGIFACVLFVISMFASILPYKQFVEFRETKIMVEELYDNTTDLNNIALTQKVIDMNRWLTDARASKETYGIFSFYYNIDLNELEYITFKD